MVPLRFLEFPLEIVHSIVNELGDRDKARLSQACSVAWDIVAPVLYTNFNLVLPGRIQYKGVADDPVLRTLDQLQHARQQTLDLVRLFHLSGFWYSCYDEVESELGRKGLVSPAVQMLNILVSHSVQKLRNLENLIWDCQIAPTDKLISTLACLPHLKHLELRLSTDHTGYPYYYPPVHLYDFSNLESLKLLVIEAPNLIDDIVTVMHKSPNLRVLQVTLGRELSGIQLELFNSRLDGARPLRLHSLELQGFSAYDTPTIWRALDPSALRELTIRCPGHASDPPMPYPNEDLEQARINNPGMKLRKETDGFWRNMEQAGVQLSMLATDMVTPALLHYLAAFPKLERLLLLPCESIDNKSEDYLAPFLEHVLDGIAPSIETLALYSRDPVVKSFVFNWEQLEAVTSRCGSLRELGIELHNNDVTLLLPALGSLHKLEVLHIMPCSESPEALEDHRRIAEDILDFLRSKEAVCPLKYLAIDSSDIYELVSHPNSDRFEAVRRSPKDWDTRSNTSALLSMGVWEW